MQALHDVVKAGYARYIGMSSCYAYQCGYCFAMSVHALADICIVHQMQSEHTLNAIHLEYDSPRADEQGADYAITHNLTPFISMQNQYSLLYREEEREMFPTLKVCLSPILGDLAIM